MAYIYDPDNKFGYKDLLPDEDSEKIIKGWEFDDEFNKIADGMGDLQTDVDDLIANSGIPDAPIDTETYGRKDGVWVYAAEKVHSHETGNISGLDEFINNHTHPIADVNGLKAELDAINNKLSKITSNLVVGGTYDLANDIVVRSTKEDEGVLMAGQPLPADGLVFDTFMILVSGGTMKGETLANGDWIVADQTGTWIPIPYSIAQAVDWGNITGKPNFDELYADDDHTHPEYLEDANSDGSQYCRKDGSWAQITGVTGPKGLGWTGGSYDGSTGIVTFTSDDGLGFSTGDLRGTNQDSRISATQIANWDTAYSWGDHGLVGYATQTWVTNKGYSTYTGADAVKTTGSQTIGGAKTFSSNVTAPDFVATSDERLKKDIVTCKTGLIDSVRGVEFTYVETDQLRAGVIAQELEAVSGLSHLVYISDDEDETRVVSYLGLIPYLIEEVKALKAQVKALTDG